LLLNAVKKVIIMSHQENTTLQLLMCTEVCCQFVNKVLALASCIFFVFVLAFGSRDRQDTYVDICSVIFLKRKVLERIEQPKIRSETGISYTNPRKRRFCNAVLGCALL
jgi:hypothetical protein